MLTHLLCHSHLLLRFPQPSDDLPIAIRKGTHSISNPHPVYNFLSFHRLSLLYFVFVSTSSSVSTPKSISEALSHPGWKQAMAEEMDALYSNDMWELIALPPGKSPVGCRWVYTVKVGLDGLFGCKGVHSAIWLRLL